MSFIWPYMLLCLVVVPLLVVMYVRIQQRRRRMVASYGSFGRLQQQGGRPIGKQRHIPPVLFLMGLTIAIVALARPEANVSLPRLEGTVVLAFDVSGSMAQNVGGRSRLELAQEALAAMIQEYDKLSKEFGFEAVDSSRSVDEIHEKIREKVKEVVGHSKPAKSRDSAKASPDGAKPAKG